VLDIRRCRGGKDWPYQTTLPGFHAVANCSQLPGPVAFVVCSKVCVRLTGCVAASEYLVTSGNVTWRIDPVNLC